MHVTIDNGAYETMRRDRRKEGSTSRLKLKYHHCCVLTWIKAKRPKITILLTLLCSRRRSALAALHLIGPLKIDSQAGRRSPGHN